MTCGEYPRGDRRAAVRSGCHGRGARRGAATAERWRDAAEFGLADVELRAAATALLSLAAAYSPDRNSSVCSMPQPNGVAGVSARCEDTDGYHREGRDRTSRARERTTGLTDCVDEERTGRPAFRVDEPARVGSRAHRQSGRIVARARCRWPRTGPQRHRRVVRRFQTFEVNRPALAAAEPGRGARIRTYGSREGLGCARPQHVPADRLERGRFRVRDDRAARAAARRNHARDPPTAHAAQLCSIAQAPPASARGRSTRRSRHSRRRIHDGNRRPTVGARQRAARAPGPRSGFAIDAARSPTGSTSNSSTTAGMPDPELWSSAGGRTASSADWCAPVLGARRFGSGGDGLSASMSRSVAGQPVVHVCFFEAEAYATLGGQTASDRSRMGEGRAVGSGHRHVATIPVGRRRTRRELANLGQRHLGPAGVGAYPSGASPPGVHQLIGDVWEWTSSRFRSVPGFPGIPVPRVLGGILRRRLQDAARRIVRHRPGRVPWDLPQLGPPDQAADLLRISLRRDLPGTTADMCRHLGYLGPPRVGSRTLHAGENSLLRQSWAPRDMRGGGTINADGFGVGWWTVGRLSPATAVPSRSGRTPPSTRRCPNIGSGAVVAAVRSATVGMPVEHTACAPFADET